jgi:RHS repeat-associated protein
MPQVFRLGRAYTRGHQRGQAIYENNAPKELPIYGSSRLGVYRVLNGDLQNDRNKLIFGRREYELSNHLGNVLATVSDVKLPAARVLSHTDYYAFGGAMPGRSGGAQYRYGFNGKENDSETGWQDYGMRMYNPRLSRFFTVDPITAQYPELTPYQFASNRPIEGVDLDGLEFYNCRLVFGGTNGKTIIGVVHAETKFHYPAGSWLNRNPYHIIMPPSVKGGVERLVEMEFASEDDLRQYVLGMDIDDLRQKDTENLVISIATSLWDAVDGNGPSAKPGKFRVSPTRKYNSLDQVRNHGYVKKGGLWDPGEYRHNLRMSTGKMGWDHDAHHTFPKAKELDEFFRSHGIDVNDPAHLVWRKRETHSSTPEGVANSQEHLKMWNEYINEIKKNKKSVSKSDIFKKRDEIEQAVWGNSGDSPNH